MISKTDLKYIVINEEKLEKLRKIGSGTFGVVFDDSENNGAIKKYHETIKNYNYYDIIPNPCLKLRKVKFKRLNKRDKKIKYSDVGVELVYINGKFFGVRKKFYDGDILDNLKSQSLVIKKKNATELIRNAKELTDFKIYNLDYKLKNIILTKQGEIKIIDLDDICTKVTLFPNYFYKIKSLEELKNTIISYFYGHQKSFPMEVINKITNKPNLAFKQRTSYSELQELVNSVRIENNLIIIDYKNIQRIDFSILKKYMDDNNLSLVISFNYDVLYSKGKIINLINALSEAGIDVYDVFQYFKNYDVVFNDYIMSNNCVRVHYYEDGFKILEKK